MIRIQGLVRWGILAVAVAGLTALYAPSLSTGFLNDDFLFLEDARRAGLTESLTRLDPLGNYYRPVSRPLYFRLLLPILGDHPLAFHLFNYALFLVALALLADLLRVFLPRTGVLVGLLYFALLPLQSVNLVWVSCAQDLLALVFALAAVACFRRGRTAFAALAYLLAVFSKESALPLPLLLLLWPAREPASALPGSPGFGSRERARALLPFAAVALLWSAVALVLRPPGTGATLSFHPLGFVAAYAHQVQSLLGLDHPPGMIESLRRNGPAPAALIALGLTVLWLGPLGGPVAERPADAPGRKPAPGVWGFGCAWLAAFGFVVGPVAATWSSYYYTLAAVGGALLAGHLGRRIGPAGWLALTGALLWWHAGATGTRAFSVDRDPWQWTSHLTSFYFQRAAALTDTLGRQLQQLEPAPSPHTRFFFATLPSWAGFQMGNGAQVRHLYGDSTLESHFYSQFSESTAAGYPCRFLYWDGQGLAPLYGPRTSVFFQVGSDLLAFGRYAGARHAFHRGLEAGENHVDHYYWLGWSEFWLGHRAAAEDAWSRFGATDDSLRWWIRMRLARMALIDRRDTLEARRQLAEAIRSGIGRPEAHAVLGPLLLAERPKYGLLELQVATSLKPDDWLARRDLVVGLAELRLDARAREELAVLERIYPGWDRDSLLAGARAEMERRDREARAVARF